MDEEIETLTVGVRADLTRFQKDISEMRDMLTGPLASGAEQATRMIETGLLRIARTGKFGFEDLRRVALSVLSQIAAAAVRDGIGAIVQGGLGCFGIGRGGGGLAGIGSGLLGALLGLPGRATGGPVAPGRGYIVGERGPEVFVPTSSGQVMPGIARDGGRDVRVSITVRSDRAEAPRALARSARQVARAVRGALGE